MEASVHAPSFGSGEDPIVHRGVSLGSAQCRRIQRVIERSPDITRMELSQRVCRMFGWVRPNGELAERSARNLLDRLHRRGWIALPRPKRCRNGGGEPSTGRLSPDQLPSQIWPENVPCTIASSPLLVRPLLPEERRPSRQCLETFHYLAYRPLVGESLVYVAFWNGEPVALMAWAAASLKNAPRDAWIGWDPQTKADRLPLVVQNVRFALLPSSEAPPHLASRVLAACLRRLSHDWHKRYGHPVLVAETFVDESRFRGTCYKAANWLRLGTTRGFARRGASYRHHGLPKAVWVYPLRPDALERLRCPTPPWPVAQEKSCMSETLCLDPERLPLVGEDGLLDVLGSIPDVRRGQGTRHPLVTVLAISVLALLHGHTGFAAIAQFATRLPVAVRRSLGARRDEPPSEPTVRRVLTKLPADTVDALINAWLVRWACRRGAAVALDGKTLRGSRNGDAAGVHLLSALLQREGVVLGQMRVSDKTNEIPCVPQLLKPLPLEGAVVTADALHTQKETARFLVEEKKADYLFVAKDNQPTLRSDIELLNLRAIPPSG